MDLARIRKGVLSGFAWQGTTKLVVQLTSWVSTLLVARLIAPSDYGVVAAAAVFVDLLVFVTDMGLSQGLIQKPQTSQQEEDGVFYISLTLGLVSYLLIYAAAPVIAGFYEMPVLTDLLRLMCLGVILGSLKTVPMAIAMRRLDFRYRSLVEMGASLMMTLTVVLLALSGFGVWSLAWGPVVSSLVMAIGYLPLLGRVPRPVFAVREVMDTVRFGLNVTGTAFLYFGWTRADVAVIGKVLGERLLGYYSMAFQLAVLPLDKIATIFNQVMFPALSRLQADRAGSRELFLQLHRYLLMISYPVLFGMAAVADDAIRVLLTDKWAPIVPYFQALCLVSALRISATMLPAVLFARGRPGVVMRYNLLALLTLPPAFLIGAQFGLQGVVLGWLLVYPLLFVYLARHGLRELGATWIQLGISAAPAVIATIAMVAAVETLRRVALDYSLPLRLTASVGLGAAVYLGVLSLLFREHISDLRNRLVLLKREAPR